MHYRTEFSKSTLNTLVTCFAFYSITACAAAPRQYSLENSSVKRTWSLEEGILRTKEIVNRRANTTLTPLACDEFQIRISEGTDTTGTDRLLTTDDFECVDVRSYKLSASAGNGIAFHLFNQEHDLTVVVSVELCNDDFYMRKHLEISSKNEIAVERIDVEAIAFEDASQPYTKKEITTTTTDKKTKNPGWRPGLGQPLFTTDSGTFWGIEFPAAYNYVAENELICGYQYGQKLTPGKAYTSYNAVVGCSDDPRYTSQVFYEYIDRIRVRPLRLQTQYNSWFDYGNKVERETFIKSVKKVNDELCVQRGVPPLKAYVIDDGWQDSTETSDWSDGVWKVNGKFDEHLASSRAAVKDADSTLGLWVSPQCNFGAGRVVSSMRKQNLGALSRWMSLANTPYMDLLETRLVELAEAGTSYFKLDGTFGHLYNREFDIHGADHRVPEMPQLDTEGFRTDDLRLNDSAYDELKIYYLTVGTERLMKIFSKMADANPDVYIVISNGAYLSPWWLMHCDAVWMINAGDAAGGSDRTAELVYRDGVYYEIWKRDLTHYPMNSLFNHEPKKNKTGESAEAFRDYLYMNMSRGTGFVELYLKTFVLSESDWDVLAEGLHWVHSVFPTFNRSCMHGGDPQKGEVYGYTAWNEEQGYISLHNPGDTQQTYELTLNRDLGLLPCETVFHTSSPLDGSLSGLEAAYRYGDLLSITLEPKEIRILNFGAAKQDWSAIKALQNRAASAE